MTVPELPLICNKPRSLNFRSWRPCWAIRWWRGVSGSRAKEPIHLRAPEHLSLQKSPSQLHSPGCSGSMGGFSLGEQHCPWLQIMGGIWMLQKLLTDEVTTWQQSSSGRNFPPSPFPKPQRQSQNLGLQQFQHTRLLLIFFFFFYFWKY